MSRLRAAAPPPMPAAEVAALRAVLAGALVTPDTPEYETLRAPAIPRTNDVRPSAIVACRTTDDVVHGLAFARRLAAPVAPRSGGHCFAGRSSPRGVVLDVSGIDQVAVDGDDAVVGAGVRLGALYDALHAHGRALPAGCGSTVGIAGLTLGGGIGVLGRSHGLTCDRLVTAEVVLADGRVVQCDAGRDPDLWWGLRGAGGGQFGVVTSLTLRTVPAPTTTVIGLRWAARYAAAVVAAWQRWAPEAPDAVDATLRIGAPADPDEPLTVHVVGVVHDGPHGGHREALGLLDELVSRVGADPAATTAWHGPYRDAKRRLAGEDTTDGGTVPVTTSGLFRRNLTADLVASLLDHLASDRPDGQPRQLVFTPLGGAYGRVPIRATAFAHRRERFLLEHSTSARPADLGVARQWARRAWAIARPAGTGRVYPNFPDPGLVDGPRAYHAENLPRLRRVKRRYDPDHVFAFHQSL